MKKFQKQNAAKQIVLGKSVLDEAKLGKNVEIIVQNGSIVILPAIKKKAWRVLERLGEGAASGVLDEPSSNHDVYLYGKGK
ncbi:MAG: hypothetical protein AAB354_09920 [candidate division KSB1 bacterium]